MTKKHQNDQKCQKHEKRPKMTKKHQKWPKIAKNTKNAFVSKMGGPKMAPRGTPPKLTLLRFLRFLSFLAIFGHFLVFFGDFLSVLYGVFIDFYGLQVGLVKCLG